MTQDEGAPAPAGQRRRRVLVVAGVVLLAAVGSGTALSLANDDPPGDDTPARDLTVGWGGSEGHPSCVYAREGNTVDATLVIEGSAPEATTVTVTVTAYADENTSRPVGSSTRDVEVEGTVSETLVVTIAVRRPPYVDIDGETACKLATTS